MMKPWLLPVFLLMSGIALAQPYPFYGYNLYDYLVTATHPQGCPTNYVLGLPDDSTWVNMNDFSVMTGYFGSTRIDQPGNDLLLEISFHRSNYSIRLTLESGGLSASHTIQEADWTEYPFVSWKHLFPGCIPGAAASPRWLLALDFTLFGIGPNEVVTGIEITFLPTSGSPDLAGVYLLTPPCPMIDLGSDLTLCPGETVDIDATNPGATYLWQDGSTLAIYPDATPGTYWVKVTVFTCTVTDTIHIFPSAAPPPLGPDFSICAGQSTLLDVTTPGAEYEWQDQSTDPTYQITAPGLYAVTVTIGECEFTDDVEVDLIEYPVIELGDDQTICEGQTFLLDAFTPDASYLWQDNAITSTYEVTLPGIYTVTVSLFGCSSTDMIEIEFRNTPDIDLGQDIEVCEGQPVLLDAYIPGATYLWQDNSIGETFDVTTSGTYTVTVTVDECSASDEIEVTYFAAFEVDLGPDTLLCPGESLSLDASVPNATYLWQDNSSAPTFQVTEPGTYFVEVHEGFCKVIDSIAISYINLPLIDLGPDTTLCEGNTYTLVAHIIGASYQWQDQSTTDWMVVSAPGLYWVNGLVNGCITSDSIDVHYSTPPAIDLGPDTTLCNPASILLDAHAPGATYLWQDNSTGAIYSVNEPGIFAVTVTNQNCSSSDTINIAYTGIDPIDLGQDTTLCIGASLVLDAGISNATFEWHDHSTASTFSVSQPGTFWVTALAGNCSTSDTIEVNYLSLLSLDLGPDTTLCMGQTYTADATLPGATYRWQDQTTAPAFLITHPGRYWVDVSIGGCMVSDTIDVAFTIIPDPELGADTTLCEGVTLLLDPALQGSTYQWQDNTNGQNYLVTLPGTYAVTVSQGACEAADTIHIAYHDLPLIDLGRDTTLCEGQSLLINALSPGLSYTWQDQSMQAEYLVTGPGLYFVDVNDGICENTDSIQVAYLSITSISLGSDTMLCDGQQLILDPHAPGAQYLWQDNSTDPTYTVDNPGLYWVQVNVGTCVATDSIQVAFADPVSVDLGPDTTLCPGATISVGVTNPAAAVEWNDHSTLPTYMISQAGIYWVTVQVMGCSTTDTISVAYIVLPEDLLGEDTTICTGETILLDATYQDATYTWQDQSTNPSIQVSEAGTYAVVVNLKGCTVEDSVNIDFAVPITFDLGVDRTICDGEMLLLDPGLSDDLHFLWQDQSTSGTLVVEDAGEYWLQVNDACGITADTVSVAVDQCQCRLYFPNVFSPNGDHVNDEALPVATCEMAYCRLLIFDRFGDQLYETQEVGGGWDGTTKSSPAQSGVYAYVLIYAYQDGIQRVMTGDVTLLK